MENGRRRTFALVIILAALLTLAWLPRREDASAGDDGTPEEKILVSLADESWTDDTLYTLSPDGSEQTELFDFHRHPQYTTGRILHLRVAPTGDSILFSSDNAYTYTPASRNLFRIASDGSGWEQITPGPNSGRWHQPGPYGTVEGTVRRTNGDPWGDSPVCLEGMDPLHAQPDGTFRFENVPEGRRWIVAYEPGDTVFDAQEIDVVAGSTYTVELVPAGDQRTSFEYPVIYGERIYHRRGANAIWWTDASGSAYTPVYTVTQDACTGVPGVDGFDVGPVSGKLAILDYQEDCGEGNPEHRGLYVTDKDGHDRQLLIDMAVAGKGWCDPVEPQGVFWSPDESRIAFTHCYNGLAFLVVYDATGRFLGSVYMEDESWTVDLYGWSPDGDWLLYFRTRTTSSDAKLIKIEVTDGGPDSDSKVELLSGARISGATWGTLTPPPRTYIYLPLVTHN